jgi:hypothetical protein
MIYEKRGDWHGVFFNSERFIERTSLGSMLNRRDDYCERQIMETETRLKLEYEELVAIIEGLKLNRATCQTKYVNVAYHFMQAGYTVTANKDYWVIKLWKEE